MLKTLILVSLLSGAAQASPGEHRLLIVNPAGKQAIAWVGPGGGYAGTTLCNEEKDGPLPSDIVLGAMQATVVNGKNQCSVDESKRAAALQAIADEQKSVSDAAAAQDKLASDLDALVTKLDGGTSLTAAELRQALSPILKEMIKKLRKQ